MKIATASRYKHRKNGSLNMISISHKNNFCQFSGKVIRKEVFCDFRSTTIDNKTDRGEVREVRAKHQEGSWLVSQAIPVKV